MATLIHKLVMLLTLTLVAAQPVWALDRMTVFVSIAPQRYFVQQIGGEMVDVQIMVLPGASPHTYEPKPKQMADLSKAKVYFAVGASFENAWLEKIAAVSPSMRIVHTDHGITKIPMAPGHQHDEEQERHGRQNPDHEDREPDPHIWLSPPLVKAQAQTIMAALQEVDPSHHAAYQANFQRFVSDIERLDADLRATFAGKQGLQFIVFHPAWGYFAQAYDLEEIPVEIEGKDPKPAQLQKLIEFARQKSIKVVFVQPQFSTKSAGLVAREIGGQVAFADPLAEDWMANLRAVADKFRSALR